MVRYTLDTCVMMDSVENPNFRDMMAVRTGIKNSEIHMGEVVNAELREHLYDVDKVIKQLGSEFDADIIKDEMTVDTYKLAARLQARHARLQSPDSYILAGCITAGTILVTRDKDLFNVANSCGVEAINPDKLASDPMTGRARSKYRRYKAAGSG